MSNPMGRPPRPIAERFWSKVDRSAGPEACWPWTARRFAFGHGQFWTPAETHGSEQTPAHRIAWELSRGPIPEGLIVRHVVCRNPPCCNPAHLEIGTVQDNIADKIRDGMQPRGSRNGAARLDEDRVAAIRRELEGGATKASLARAFGVSESTIRFISNGTTWKTTEGSTR